jgi:hypothetical protein
MAWGNLWACEPRLRLVQPGLFGGIGNLLPKPIACAR